MPTHPVEQERGHLRVARLRQHGGQRGGHAGHRSDHHSAGGHEVRERIEFPLVEGDPLRRPGRLRDAAIGVADRKPRQIDRGSQRDDGIITAASDAIDELCGPLLGIAVDGGGRGQRRIRLARNRVPGRSRSS
jgi:hypothetical protein